MPLGLPVIGIMHGIGIAVTVSFLTRNTSSDDDEDRRPFLERYGMAVLNAVFNTLFLWGFGALAHAWM